MPVARWALHKQKSIDEAIIELAVFVLGPHAGSQQMIDGKSTHTDTQTQTHTHTRARTDAHTLSLSTKGSKCSTRKHQRDCSSSGSSNVVMKQGANTAWHESMDTCNKRQRLSKPRQKSSDGVVSAAQQQQLLLIHSKQL